MTSLNNIYRLTYSQINAIITNSLFSLQLWTVARLSVAFPLFFRSLGRPQSRIPAGKIGRSLIISCKTAKTARPVPHSARTLPSSSGRQRVDQRLDIAVAIGEGDTRGVAPVDLRHVVRH